MEYDVHPLAALFPEMSGDDYTALCDSIRDHGQKDAIVLYEGKILDGRNRYRACRELEVPPHTVQFFPKPKLSPEDFVWAANVARRHLTEDQRVMVLQKLDGWKLEQEAAARKHKGQQSGGRGRKKNSGADSAPSKKTHQVLADKAKVSTHKARQAQTVAKQAPELTDKVIRGEMPLKEAEKLAKAKEPAKRRNPQLMDARKRRDFVMHLELQFRNALERCPPKKELELASEVRRVVDMVFGVAPDA